MKILIYSDIHWNTHSSLVRSRGDKYSTRLEYLIRSMNWINQIAEERGCDKTICAGDFMDRNQLTDEEITALQDIKWSSHLDHWFLCGNHESSVSDLRYSSLKALEASNRKIVDKLTLLRLVQCDILFLPYIVESDRQVLSYYLTQAGITRTNKPLIVISHNDIAGINYAGFESKLGFSIKEIMENCDLYLNGHLHNSEWITQTILNVGSFTAHNFTNNSNVYNYGAWILDTDTLQIEFIENPYGFNFYKFEIEDTKQLSELYKIKDNAVLSIKCCEKIIAEVKVILEELSSKILESRITIIKQYNEQDHEVTIAELQSDHFSKFIDFCRANIVNSDVLEVELGEICK